MGNIRKEFPEIGLIDAFAEKLTEEQTIARIADFNPDILAFSCLTTQISDAAQLTEDLRKGGSKALSVVGGPHVSRNAEDTLREFPCFDHTISGEGEETMLELLRAARDGSSAAGIKGLYSLADGEILTGGPRPYIENLDALEFPDWTPFKFDAYCASFRLKSLGIRELCVSINRGCPFNCIFCSKIMGNKIRKRSIPRVIEEIEKDIRDFGAKQILFTDETFSIDRDTVMELCETMIRKNIHKQISWVADTRPDMVDDELIALMKKSNCYCLSFGADSTDDSVLRYLKKNARAANIYTAIKMCAKHGLRTQAAYILGLPADTEQSIKNNIRGALKVNSDFATFSILVPYPGTKIMEMAESGTDGLVLLTKDWRLYGKQLGCALETKNLNRKKLEKLQRSAYYRYYLRPSRIRNIFEIADPKKIFFYFISHLLRLFGIKADKA